MGAGSGGFSHKQIEKVFELLRQALECQGEPVSQHNLDHYHIDALTGCASATFRGVLTYCTHHVTINDLREQLKPDMTEISEILRNFVTSDDGKRLIELLRG